MSPFEYVIVAVVLLAGAAALGGAFIVAKSVRQTKTLSAVPSSLPISLAADPEAIRRGELQAKDIVEQGRRDADRLLKEAELKGRDEAFRRKEEITRELEKTRTELRELERRLEKKEDALDDQQKELSKKDRNVEQLQKKLGEKREELDRKEKHLDEVISDQMKKLSQLTGLPREEAEKMLLDRLERELSEEVATKIRLHTENLKQQSEAKAREILTTAIHRYAAEHTADTTVSTVDIPSDDMKGRIIGREGRNIRTFEKGDRRGRDRGRHAGRRHRQRLRQHSPRNGPAGTDQADPGRPHSPDAHRGGGARRRRRRWRSTSWKSAGRRCWRRTSAPLHEKIAATARPAQVPHQLQPKRPPAQPRSRAPLRHDGRRAGPGRPKLARRCGLLARHRQGGRPRDGGRPPEDRRGTGQALRRNEPGSVCTPSSATTTT